MRKEKKEKIIAVLVGKDGFQREICLREFCPTISIPIMKPLNAYLESQQVFESSIEDRKFNYFKKKERNFISKSGK